MLCLRSAFFKAALNGEFQESKESQVWLKELNPEAFLTFKDWLYTGELNCFGSVWFCDLERMHPKWDLGFKLYQVAEFLIIPDLQNKVMNNLISMTGPSKVPVVLIQKTWDQMSSPQLRKFMLDAFIGKCLVGLVIKSSEDIISKDFIFEVAKELSSLMSAQKKKTSPYDHDLANRCKHYHVHDSGKLCQGTEKPKTPTQVGLKPGQPSSGFVYSSPALLPRPSIPYLGVHTSSFTTPTSQ